MCGIPLCNGSLGIDEAFADVGGILAFGNVIQRRARHIPLPLNLMASHTGGNGVFLEISFFPPGGFTPPGPPQDPFGDGKIKNT